MSERRAGKSRLLVRDGKIVKEIACACQPDWGVFLHVRHLLIMTWIKEGRSWADIAETLSMDPTQVQLIGMTPLDSTHRYLGR